MDNEERKTEQKEARYLEYIITLPDAQEYHASAIEALATYAPHRFKHVPILAVRVDEEKRADLEVLLATMPYLSYRIAKTYRALPGEDTAKGHEEA